MKVFLILSISPIEIVILISIMMMQSTHLLLQCLNLTIQRWNYSIKVNGSVDVLTIAAPNLRNIYNYDRKELTSILEKRIRRIYSILKYKKTDIAILGAFGCGAFYNPPEIVSSLFFSILKEYLFDFETIEFAIYASRSDDRNYLTFKEALKKETF